MIKEIVDKYGTNGQLDMVVEQCSQLIYAISHYKRANGQGYKTSDREEVAYNRLVKEIALTENALSGLIYIMEIPPSDLLHRVKISDNVMYFQVFDDFPHKKE